AAEVLVVDDGSRDGSVTLLRQLEAQYYENGLRVLLLPQQLGLPGLARNQLLQHATYRYVQFLDADNELVAENIYHFYRAIRQTQAAVVYGNVVRRTHTGESLDLISNESFQASMFDDNTIDMLVMTDRLQLLDAGGFADNPILRTGEDQELFLHLAT